MSNRAHFTRTKFSDVDGNNVTYGYRVADDYDMYYDDTWITPGPEEDLEFLQRLKETASEDVQTLLDWVEAEANGCYINDTWYDYVDLLPVLNNSEDDDGEEA